MNRFLFLLAVSSGCVKPIPVDILSERPVSGPAFQTPRACSIEVAPVVDRRPAHEVVGNGQTRLKYLVPLLIWFQWENAGPHYGNPELYAMDLLPDVGTLLRRTVESSGLCTGGGPTLTLRPTLDHYYGVSYQKSFSLATIGGAAVSAYDFHPAAEVTLTLQVFEGDRLVGETSLTERYLYNPADGLNTVGGNVGVSQARHRSPSFALHRVLDRVPNALDQLIARLDNAATPSSNATFLVVRVLREYDYVEELRIETATGRVISDRVVRNTLPPLGAVDEWVVAPVDSAGRWMSPQGYRAFITTLSRTYDVRFEGNLSAATFYGSRPRG